MSSRPFQKPTLGNNLLLRSACTNIHFCAAACLYWATDFHLIASYGNFANLRSIAQVFSWQWPERYHKWVPNFQLLEGLCFSNLYHWECYHEHPLKSSLDVSLEYVISFFCHVNHVIVLLCCDQGYVLTQKSLWFGAPKWIPVLFLYNFTVFPH